MKIYTINVILGTRKGDVYDQVAINKYPIIYIDNDNDPDWDDPELRKAILSHVKNGTIRNKSLLYVRYVNTETGEVEEYNGKLNDFIKPTDSTPPANPHKYIYSD